MVLIIARNDQPVSSKFKCCLYAKHADVSISKLSEKSNKNLILFYICFYIIIIVSYIYICLVKTAVKIIFRYISNDGIKKIYIFYRNLIIFLNMKYLDEKFSLNFVDQLHYYLFQRY